MADIREVQFGKPPSNDDVITMLEEWLAMARDGQVQAIGLIGVKPGGIVSTEWRGLEGGGLHELIAGISILNYRVLGRNIHVCD